MQNDNNHKNLAAAILENGGYSSDTSLTIPTTSAATFPDVPFFATIMPTTDLANSNNSEIVEVTATSTSGSDTTFTISRGQRGTTAINWDAGKAVLVHAIYTEDVVYIDTTLSTPTNIAYVSEDNIQTGAVTTSKIANGAVTSQNIDFETLSSSDVTLGAASITSFDCKKMLGYVFLCVSGNINPNQTWQDYFALPSGWKPVVATAAAFFVADNPVNNQELQTNGVFHARCANAGSNQGYRLSMVYRAS